MRRALPLVIAALALATVAPARASVQVIVSPPAGSAVGFATPVVIAVSAAPLTSVNLDNSVLHNVESVAKGPNGKPWCAAAGYPSGQCPLFWSPLIRSGETAPVQGVAGLPPGSTHQFKCVLHGIMTGTLVVV